MGIPLFRKRIQRTTHHDLSYNMTPGDEVKDPLKRRLVSLACWWKQDQSLLLQDMVAAIGLVPSKHLGNELTQLQFHLHKLKELYGINVCAEGGEYETLTLDCTLFKNARIVLDKYEKFAPLSDTDYKKTNEVPVGVSNLVHELVGKEKYLFITCWLQDASNTSLDLREDLRVVLTKIELLLIGNDCSWENVLHIHLYIADMNEVALANDEYVKSITQEKLNDPVILYILVPDLPKRAMVEVKPLLYNGENMEIPTNVTKQDLFKKQACWGFEHESWHNVLLENDIFWDDILNLRIYFSTIPETNYGALSTIFTNAFAEFAEMRRIDSGTEPFFTLVPILGAGTSATAMDNILTCELFARKF
ncbi:diphthine--ammonia ligase [Salvia divinorum]|uniref:Diphthine--ammonia ligase n=1 Tax=Salvia divinorum TaxID=28513 RepID=A0ABD1H2R5_SALDI